LVEGGINGNVCGGGATGYGGNNPSDDSGVLSHVRIEFAGYFFGFSDAVNGLTLAGVGSQTQIDHVQVSYSNDDSFQLFGGTVSCSYLVSFGSGDDDFDATNGHQGNVQFFFGLRDPDESDPFDTSHGMEAKNEEIFGESTAVPFARSILSNVTMVGPERTDAHVPFPLGETFTFSCAFLFSTQTNLFNAVVMGYPWGLQVRGATTSLWAGADSLQVRNTSIQATLQPPGSSHIHDEVQWSGVDAWFQTVAWDNLPANSATRQPDTIQLNDMSDLSNPDPRPTGTSELIGSGDFTNPRLAGFVSTSYRGAFPDTKTAGLNQLWTAYWTNFDPQNTNYDDGLPTAIGGGPQYASYLSQNYPNPFNPQTTIDFVVPAAGPLTLEVFDARGAKVASLVDGVKSKGNHTVSFNAQGLASGVYFYRLKGTGFNEMRKMVLLK
jgi:hypothetical protein